MEAKVVIDKARYILSDSQSDNRRWSDDRLISALNDALLDIAATTELYNTKGLIKLERLVPVYDVSNFVIRIDRVEHLGKTLTFSTFSEMDALFGDGWQDTTAESPTHIVFDLKQAGEFRVYPKPEVKTNSLYSDEKFYGIITDIEYTEVEIEVKGDSGDIADPDLSDYIVLYFIESPPEISSITDDMGSAIDSTLISTLAHYVSGSALMDNSDVQNIEISKTEIGMYKEGKFLIPSSSNNVKTIRNIKYNPTG